MDVYYVNGSFVEQKDAMISVNDLAVLRGYGVFDFLRTYNRCPFHMHEHLDRLERSAKLVGLQLPKPKSEIATLCLEGIKRSEHDENKVRIVVTGGNSQDGISPDNKPGLILIVTGVTERPESWNSEGVKVVTSHVDRFMPGSKSINYIPAILSQQDATAQGAIESIFVDRDGYLQEGTTSNFFIFMGDTLITPPGVRILPGITRKIVLELMKKDFKILERNIHKDEIRLIDEAFISSSVREVVPVSIIDAQTVTQGVGKNTSIILDRFRSYTASYRI